MKAAVEMDMFGCPNRCKHCWLGHASNTHIPAEDFVWVAEQFKNYRRDGKRFFDELIFSTYLRELDYEQRYKELHDLENSLNDGLTIMSVIAYIEINGNTIQPPR